MSQENVEAVRRVYEAFVKSHAPPWDLFTTDAVMDATGASPDVLVIRERHAAEAALRSYAETFESFQVQLDEVLVADDAHVVTAVRDGGRVKGSGAQMWNRYFHVFSFRDGKIAGWSAHTDRQAALEAVGLSE